jgi:hypothetical protein
MIGLAVSTSLETHVGLSFDGCGIAEKILD